MASNPLSPTERLIYDAYLKRDGRAAADRWLKAYLPTKPDFFAPSDIETLHTPEVIAAPQALQPLLKLRRPVEPVPVGPAEVTRRLTASLARVLTPTVLETFRLLHMAALKVAERRGYAPSVTRVTFFCPAEVVAYARGVNRTTLWRHLAPLKKRGIIAARAHMTELRGKTRTDGYLWCVKLHPNGGRAPRLGYEELKAQYRDLAGDIKKGRTVYAWLSDMQQSDISTEGETGLEHILSWTLSPLTDQTPVSHDCCKSRQLDLEAILDVPFAAKPGRNAAVDLAAKAICYALGDSRSYSFYCKLLWNLLRRYDQGQDWFLTVYDLVKRVRADRQEGFAVNAGKLFMSRLKKWEVWDELERTPPYRVGTAPNRE